MAVQVPKVILSWSSGKDSAWALHLLRQRGDVEVVGLLTTFNESFDRVAMHAVRRELVEAQAASAGLPLLPVMLPYPCSNEVYEARMGAAIAEARESGVTHMAFGDLFLEDVRAYRVRLLDATGIEPLFPIWSSVDETPALARRMLSGGLKAVVTCVDPKQLGEGFLGREYDEGLLADLPAGVDPCGERGEFHTFCHACSEFSDEIPVAVGEFVHRDGFWFADVEDARRDRKSGEGMARPGSARKVERPDLGQDRRGHDQPVDQGMKPSPGYEPVRPDRRPQTATQGRILSRSFSAFRSE